MQQKLRDYIPVQLKKLNQWIILNKESEDLYGQVSTESLQECSEIDL